MMPALRWSYQYQRIADVLQQRVEQLKPDPHRYHRGMVRKDGYCHICTIVNAAPPLTETQRAILATLLQPAPPANAALNDPVALGRAAKIMRSALARQGK